MPLQRALLDDLARADLRTIEDLALAAIALRNRAVLLARLTRAVESNGAWACVPGAPPNTFHTALALLALRAGTADLKAQSRAVEWLLRLQPAEAHPLWRWKFRFSDRQVRFDSTKFGWPWVPGTISWVAPTAVTILALRACGVDHPRLSSATAMLIDRACAGGGWNAGNSVVFGVSLDAHPDFTAMALLALKDTQNSEAVAERGLAYLGKRLPPSHSIYSLAWGVLALAAYQSPARAAIRSRLERITSQHRDSTPRALALASLALEEPPYIFRGPRT